MSGAFGGVPNAFQNAVTATGLQLDNNNATISAYINDPTNRNNFATDSGNTATFAIALAPAASGYTAGLWITFKATNANAANPQVNVNALGAKNLVDQNKSGLLANAIPAGGIVDAVYDGTSFVHIGPQNVLNAPQLSNPVFSGTITGTINFVGPVTIGSATSTVTGAISGPWTPADGSSSTLTFSLATGSYVKTGNQVTVQAVVTYPSTASGTNAAVSGLPFPVAAGTNNRAGAVVSSDQSTLMSARWIENSSSISFHKSDGTRLLNSDLSLKTLYIGGSYFIA